MGLKLTAVFGAAIGLVVSAGVLILLITVCSVVTNCLLYAGVALVLRWALD